MKIFIQLSIIFLMINPMVIVCSKKSSQAQLNKSKSNKSKLDASKEEIIRYENGITTTLIKDSQTGKIVGSKTQLNDGIIVHQVMDGKTGKKVSGTVIHPDGLRIGQTFDANGKLIEQHIIDKGLALSDKAPVKSESTSTQLTSSIASKPKSLSTMAKDGTATVIKDAKVEQTGGVSTIQLQGRDRQTGKQARGKKDAQPGLALSDKASIKNESTSIQLTSSVASKPKSVSTIAAGGREQTWESKSFDKKADSKVPDVTALDTANMKDSVGLALIQDNPTSKTINKEGNKSLQAKPPATQSFVSEIAWSKLIPTKTISKATSKTISSAVDRTSNFFKNVSLAFKEKISGMELSRAEESFAVRNQREQIQKIGKQINKITSNILEKETQLKQSRQELQIEKAQPASQPVWIAKHKKDIAQIKQTIEKQQQQKKSLQEQQTKLMADKFNDRGHLIVKSASE